MPNNHGRSPRQNNGLHSDCLSYAPSSHGGYAAGLGTLRASGGDIGGGTEVLIVSYQEITGPLSQGAHPGSYNGQDAYNDMLVTEYPIMGGGDLIEAQTAYGYDSYNQATSEEVAQTLKSQKGGDDTPRVATSIVRRLTPLECERLQGMPDNWSKYGINEKGETYELPDSARYRLQGNGIATPFWRYLLKRISAQYERTPTLGSLFDGQASFPMIWEGINGPGAALWSSEIEKHAIAVAKYHFPEEGE